jgi:DNA-binding HxlR family transcriptional regulator
MFFKLALEGARVTSVSTRTYGQHCGLAGALDLLGERWTLLVVRELALGPRRYGDLAAALPGIGTNLLAARLKALTEAGVVRQATLPPPANVRVYELTERGETLRAPLKALALWGYELLPAEPDDLAAARPSLAALTMAAAADEHGPPPPAARGTFAFRVDEERFHVALGDGDARVRLGDPPTVPAATVATDRTTFFALATGALAPAEAPGTGGDPAALDALFSVFRLPAAVG